MTCGACRRRPRLAELLGSVAWVSGGARRRSPAESRCRGRCAADAERQPRPDAKPELGGSLERAGAGDLAECPEAGDAGELAGPISQLIAAESALRGRLRDRKSTRLNSSHVRISYAVFCLKKKK